MGAPPYVQVMFVSSIYIITQLKSLAKYLMTLVKKGFSIFHCNIRSLQETNPRYMIFLAYLRQRQISLQYQRVR